MNRKKQEKLQRERRQRNDLLALTLVSSHGHNTDTGAGHSKLRSIKHDDTGVRHNTVDQSDSSDHHHQRHQRHHHHDHDHHDLPGVHGQDQRTAVVAGDDDKKKSVDNKLERVHKVEQTTVHTVITTSEKINNNNKKHLPSLGGCRQRSLEDHTQGPSVHQYGRVEPGHGHGQYGRVEPGHGHGQYHGGGGSSRRVSSDSDTGQQSQSRSKLLSGSKSSAGAGHLKTLMKQDSGEARSGIETI